jgi:hypothetical protein
VTQSDTAPGKVNEWPVTALVFVAVTTGLVAILANLLNFNNYPIARPEVAIVLLAMVLAGAIAAAIHRLAQPRLSFAFTGLYVAILTDLCVNYDRMVILGIAAAAALAAWFGERLVLKMTTAIFASVLLFQSAEMAMGNAPPSSLPNKAERLQAKSAGNEQRPPIIHLMLDSYIGLDGMTAPDTQFGDLRRQQEQFYLSHDFQIYPGSYSRHSKTVNSLPEFLSYGTAKRATASRDVQHDVAAPLNYFVDLDRLGYRTSVLSPAVVDLCPNQPLTTCNTYNRSSLADLDGSGLSVWDRSRMIGMTMMEFSVLAVLVTATVDYNLADLTGSTERHSFNRAKVLSLTGLRQLDSVTRDLATLRNGEVRFVHLLVPHDPLILDAKCKLLPEPDWIDEHGPAPLAERDAAYARQTRCVTEVGLKKFMAALDQTEAGRSAIVIIQGDHGARTVDNLPFADSADVDARSLIVTYSAFFAIRVPGQPAVAISGQFALDELLGGFAASGFTAAPRPVSRPAEVFLMDRKWVPAKRVALPPSAPGLPAR